MLRIGIVTVSDRAFKGEYDDESGVAVENYFREKIVSAWEKEYLLVPDTISSIKNAIVKLSDKLGCNIVITTGGTGPASRDVTPDATEMVCSRMLPGFGEQMRAESLKYIHTAILSRQTAGIRGNTFIINLPGKPDAIKQCLDGVFKAIPDCIHLIGGPKIETNDPDIKVMH